MHAIAAAALSSRVLGARPVAREGSNWVHGRSAFLFVCVSMAQHAHPTAPLALRGGQTGRVLPSDGDAAQPEWLPADSGWPPKKKVEHDQKWAPRVFRDFSLIQAESMRFSLKSSHYPSVLLHFHSIPLNPSSRQKPTHGNEGLDAKVLLPWDIHLGPPYCTHTVLLYSTVPTVSV